MQSEGPFTVFAPTDDAFAALPEGLVEARLLPENVDALKSILTYHVVSGQVHAADVTTGDVPTVEGGVGQQYPLITHAENPSRLSQVREFVTLCPPRQKNPPLFMEVFQFAEIRAAHAPRQYNAV